MKITRVERGVSGREMRGLPELDGKARWKNQASYFGGMKREGIPESDDYIKFDHGIGFATTTPEKRRVPGFGFWAGKGTTLICPGHRGRRPSSTLRKEP